MRMERRVFYRRPELWRPPERRPLIGTSLRAMMGAAGNAGDGGFDPLDLPNLVHFYHSVDSAKTGSPGTVTTWEDLVGALDLDSSAGTGPDDNTETFNGHAVLNFDGVNDEMQSAGAPNLSANGTAYIFIVCAPDTHTNGDPLVNMGGPAAANDGFSLIQDAAFSGRLELTWSNGTSAGTYRPPTPTYSLGSQHLFEAWIIGTNGGANLAIDGTDAAGTTNTFGMGAPDELDIFNRASGLNADGKVAIVGICTAVPDASNRAALLAYSQSFWGTP